MAHQQDSRAVMRTGSVTLIAQVLEAFGVACGVEIDAALARQAAQSPEQDRQGDWSATWRAWLVRAGDEVGLRVSTWTGSLLEAARHASRDAPLVLMGVGEGESPRAWALLEKQAGCFRIVDLSAGVELLLTKQETLSLLGLTSEHCRAEWALAQPAKPYGHGHGHPDGHDHHPVSPVRRLLMLLRAERRDIRLVILFAIGIGILSLATPIAVEALVTNVAFGGAFMQPVVVLSLVLLAFLTVAAAIRALQKYVVEIMQQRIFVRVVADLAYRLPRVHRSAFDRQHGPELVNRFFEVLTVQKAGSTLLLDGFALVMQTLIGLVLLALYHPLLLGFDIILLLAIALIVFGLGRGGIRTSIEESKAKYAMAGWLEEIARHPLAFKLSGGPDFAIEQADRLARVYLKERKGHYRVLFRQIVGTLALQAIAAVAVLGLGGFLVIQQQLTLGQLVAAELVVAMVLASVSKMGKSLENFYDLAASVDKLGHLMDLPLEREGGEGHPRHEGPASLRLDHVTFSYQGRGAGLSTQTWSVAPGERVALVGPSGAGKSTLVELIYGLREPISGHIELDGIDIRDLRLDVLRHHVTTAKNVEVFSGTVIENVRMGRTHLTLSDIRAGLEAVGLLRDILALPDGLSTILATDGAPLSDGQARRLMLARAIVGKPRLLVLDEFLDDLDVSVRDHVHQALFDRNAPWTLLVVTHDPDVPGLCDRTIHLLPAERNGIGGYHFAAPH